MIELLFSERWSNSLWGSDILLFSEFINVTSTLFHNFIDYVVIYFSSNFFSSIQRIYDLTVSFIKFSDVLAAFTCTSAVGNLWVIYLEVSILSPLPSSCLLKL